VQLDVLAMDTFLGFKTGVRRSAALQTMTGQDIRNIPGVIDFREDPKNHSVLIFIDDPNVEQEVRDLFSLTVYVEFHLESVDYDRSEGF